MEMRFPYPFSVTTRTNDDPTSEGGPEASSPSATNQTIIIEFMCVRMYICMYVKRKTFKVIYSFMIIAFAFALVLNLDYVKKMIYFLATFK